MKIPIKLEKRTDGERKAYAEGYSAGKRDAVRHGRWIDNEIGYSCSICLHGSPNGAKWNYCPNCGARMDEVTE